MNVFSSLRRIFPPCVLVFLVLLVIFAFLLTQVFAALFVVGHSMDPTMRDGQFLIGLSAQNIPFLKVSRGDVVVVDCPQLDLRICKRIIGMPGDRLQLIGGQLYINGVYQYEPYIYEPMVDDSYGNTPEMVVPEGYFYVMGDNRNISMDSRSLGLIPEEQVQFFVFPQHQALVTLIFVGAFFLVFAIPNAISDWMERKFPSETDSAPKGKATG